MSEAGNDPGNPGCSRPALSTARGLIGRRTTAPITPGRLPSIRSRDLTLGGVKKKTFAPNIISRKIKEEPKEDVSIKKEKKERDRDRQRDGHGRGRGRPEVIQSHSIFEQGPAEMMKKRGTWDKTVDMSDFGPSHIINIKKEKRETDEETKQILRMLEKDDFLDDPGLKNDIRNKPVQLPLAHSGWLFKEESDDQEDVKHLSSSTKEEMMEMDMPPVKGRWSKLDNWERFIALPFGDCIAGYNGCSLIAKSCPLHWNIQEAQTSLRCHEMILRMPILPTGQFPLLLSERLSKGFTENEFHRQKPPSGQYPL
ncbi:UNVERIFIED_CONTAM: DNA-directed RNA polymerase III subunit RPC4 [Gekko kuhli]